MPQTFAEMWTTSKMGALKTIDTWNRKVNSLYKYFLSNIFTEMNRSYQEESIPIHLKNFRTVFSIIMNAISRIYRIGNSRDLLNHTDLQNNSQSVYYWNLYFSRDDLTEMDSHL